jgi:hypothetical protein
MKWQILLSDFQILHAIKNSHLKDILTSAVPNVFSNYFTAQNFDSYKKIPSQSFDLFTADVAGNGLVLCSGRKCRQTLHKS